MLPGQGIEVVEIGNVRQPDHGDVQLLPLLEPRRRLGGQFQGYRVLFGDVNVPEVVDHTGHRNPGPLFQPGQAVGQQAGLAPELVDHESLDRGALLRLQQFHGAHDGGEHPAPVDVGAEQDGGLGVPGNPHVHDFIGLQVDLGWAARSLHYHNVVVVAQGVQGGADRVPELGLQPQVVASPGRAHGAAQQHHLGGVVGLGLQQDRVHLHPGLYPRRLGLHRLSPADFASPRGYVGIVGHVLGLEGSDAETVLAKYAAQRRHQHALADVRGRSLDHDYFAWHILVLSDAVCGAVRRQRTGAAFQGPTAGPIPASGHRGDRYR